MKIKYKTQEINVNIDDGEVVIHSLEEGELKRMFETVIKPIMANYYHKITNSELYDPPSIVHG